MPGAQRGETGNCRRRTSCQAAKRAKHANLWESANEVQTYRRQGRGKGGRGLVGSGASTHKSYDGPWDVTRSTEAARSCRSCVWWLQWQSDPTAAAVPVTKSHPIPALWTVALPRYHCRPLTGLRIHPARIVVRLTPSIQLTVHQMAKTMLPLEAIGKPCVCVCVCAIDVTKVVPWWVHTKAGAAVESQSHGMAKAPDEDGAIASMSSTRTPSMHVQSPMEVALDLEHLPWDVTFGSTSCTSHLLLHTKAGLSYPSIPSLPYVGLTI